MNVCQPLSVDGMEMHILQWELEIQISPTNNLPLKALIAGKSLSQMVHFLLVFVWNTYFLIKIISLSLCNKFGTFLEEILRAESISQKVDAQFYTLVSIVIVAAISLLHLK